MLMNFIFFVAAIVSAVVIGAGIGICIFKHGQKFAAREIKKYVDELERREKMQGFPA